MTRSLFWRGLEWLSLEHLRLELEPVIRADGLVLGEFEGTPFRLRYVVHCDSGWNVRELLVEDPETAGPRIEVTADGAGNWSDADGGTLAEFNDCIDVDIAATPFTNTLPIRRLELDPGQSSQIDVVYVAVFPALELRLMQQRYTCLELGASGGRYLYESIGSDFRAELLVDRDGLVVDYPGLWERATS